MKGNDFAAQIAKEFREQRKAKYLRLRDVYEASGVSVQMLSKFELSGSNIRLNTLKSMCDACDIELIIKLRSK